MKKTFISLLVLALLAPTFATLMPMAASYDHENTYTIKDFDAKAGGGVTLYPNDTNETRVIRAEDYGFRYSKLMIFNKDGLLIEAGGDLVANPDGTNGSCQSFVSIPAGGFMIAFPSGTQGLQTCFTTAMEGAMLYNATMSITYPVYGSYNKDAKTLSIRYDDPEAPSKDAPRFLFVGNSTTYFNGTPIKFKAMAAAAGKEIVVEYCTFGSAFLSEFADAGHERGKALRNKLNTTKYDYVVLQDAASADYFMSKAALDKIIPLIEANGAQAVLYMRYSTGDEGTQRHYNNYPRLAKDFDLPVANVTGAFNICRKEYPDINLLAEDLGHHSCEGSYLIAATWLEAYLGINPVGNSYTANLPAATVAALQDCAVKVAEEGLELPEKDTSLTIDGEKYDLVSKDKSYTVVGSIYDGKWTDAADNGLPLGKRTDGNFAAAGDETSIGCWSDTTGTGTTSITIDLEEVFKLKAFKADLWGGTWGIPSPEGSSVAIDVSTDGKSFTSLGEASFEDLDASGEWKGKLFTLILEEEVDSRYVKFTYTLTDGNKKFCWSSEAAVYGTATEQPSTGDESSTEESSEAETSEESSEETSTEAPAESTPAESTPAESSAAPAEDGGSATLWIILGVAAAAIAAVVGVLFARKKKA